MSQNWSHKPVVLIILCQRVKGFKRNLLDSLSHFEVILDYVYCQDVMMAGKMWAGFWKMASQMSMIPSVYIVLPYCNHNTQTLLVLHL